MDHGIPVVGWANAGEAPAEKVRLTLPHPPSGGTRLGMRAGTFFRTAAYKRWMAEVCAIVRALKVRPFVDGRLAMQVIYYPATKRLSDIDNYLKTLNDGLQHAGVFRDDKLDYIVAQRVWGSGRGEVEVTIWRLPGA